MDLLWARKYCFPTSFQASLPLCYANSPYKIQLQYIIWRIQPWQGQTVLSFFVFVFSYSVVSKRKISHARSNSTRINDHTFSHCDQEIDFFFQTPHHLTSFNILSSLDNSCFFVIIIIKTNSNACINALPVLIPEHPTI